MAIPFGMLAGFYPDYWRYPLPGSVKKLVGGETNDGDVTNTCTIRMSHAMNLSGFPIPAVWEGIPSRRGRNGKFYILRVVNLRPWIASQFGKPDMDFHKQPGKAFDRKQIEGREGLIAFEISFGDATGHIDLWYQKEFSHEKSAGKDYFMLASRISLWTTGTVWTEAPV